MAWNVLLIEEIVEKRGPIMLDFCDVIILKGRNGTIVRPEFVMYHNDKPVRDIMVKGGDFYAFWDEEKNIWNRNEIDCYKAIDKKVMSYAVGSEDEDKLKIDLMKNSSSGMVELWRRYLKNELRDTYIQLDSKVTFLNDTITREDYRSKRLPYSIENGSIKNWNRILSVLYDEEERTKIEWAIGAIVSGDSTEIQKFVVFYGPAGAGKGTITKLVAEKLNLVYIDTGAMYRCIALQALRNNIVDNTDKIIEMTKDIDIVFNEEGKTFLNGEDVSEEIRSKEVTSVVSPISSIVPVREEMVNLQRKLALGRNVIMEGRDITTVVFPNADFKFYLDASVEERTKRRVKQNEEKGIFSDYDEIKQSIIERDYNDMHKEVGTLKRSDSQIYIDSTNMSKDEVVNFILEKVGEVK